MFTFISILIILLSLIITLMVIIQNPKGGGTMGSIAGSASNVIGVQRTGDILEKGTWGGAIVLLLFCVLTVFVAPKTITSSKSKTISEEAAKTTPVAPTPTAPTPVAPIGNSESPLQPAQ